MAKSNKSAFSWEDPFNLSAQLTEDERAVQEAARAYCQDKLASRVVEGFRHEKLIPPSSAKWAHWACSASRFLSNMAARV